jgi:hypothetical protein
MIAIFVAIIGMIDRFFNFGNYHWSLRRAFWICCDLCRFITFRLAAWRLGGSISYKPQLNPTMGAQSGRGTVPSCRRWDFHPGWVQTDMGGAKADITVDESSSGLLRRFDLLGPDTTG